MKNNILIGVGIIAVLFMGYYSYNSNRMCEFQSYYDSLKYERSTKKQKIKKLENYMKYNNLDAKDFNSIQNIHWC